MSIRLKTILGVGIIEAILLIILVSSVINNMKKAQQEHMQSYSSTTVNLIKATATDFMLSFDLASLESLSNEVMKNETINYIRFVNKEGIVLSSKGKQELLEKEFVEDFTLRDINDTTFDSQSEIIIDEQYYGKIQIGLSVTQLSEMIDDTKKAAITIAAIEMVLVALFSLALGYYLTRRLKILRDFARGVSEGDLDNSINVVSNDEVGEVSIAFNKMIEKLKNSQLQNKQFQEDLVILNIELEERVRTRTHQLEASKITVEQSYQKLQEAQKKLVHSEKLASIGQLAAGVAHEINNPVGFVRSNLQSLNKYINSLLLINNKIISINTSDMEKIQEKVIECKHLMEDEDVDFIMEDAHALISESIEGTDRINTIVQSLKSYSREGSTAHSQHNINDAITSTINLLRNELKYKCKVSTSLAELPFTACNIDQLTQVFTNLLMNSLQAMDKEGTIEIESLTNENNIHVVVKDNGKGMEESTLQRLFDPFFTTKGVGEGTGLGLSISQGIIEDHKGTIDVESQLGKGTIFTIILPIA